MHSDCPSQKHVFHNALHAQQVIVIKGPNQGRTGQFINFAQSELIIRVWMTVHTVFPHLHLIHGMLAQFDTSTAYQSTEAILDAESVAKYDPMH